MSIMGSKKRTDEGHEMAGDNEATPTKPKGEESKGIISGIAFLNRKE